MAELNFPKASVWQEFELETELITPPKIRLQIQPILSQEKTKRLLHYLSRGMNIQDKDIIKAFDESVAILLEKVIGWDLTKREKPIPCNKVNKDKYLAPLLWEKPKTEVEEPEELDTPDETKEKKPDLWFWMQLINFASDLKNFTKN